MSLTVNLSVSLPYEEVEKIDERVEETDAGNRSEYIRSLYRDDIEQAEETNVTLARDGNGELDRDSVDKEGAA